jgi:hypothetical protein
MSLLHGLDSQTCPHADAYMNIHIPSSYYCYVKRTCAAVGDGGDGREESSSSTCRSLVGCHWSKQASAELVAGLMAP